MSKAPVVTPVAPTDEQRGRESRGEVSNDTRKCALQALLLGYPDFSLVIYLSFSAAVGPLPRA
jgi:hypothetical protein